MTIWRLLGSTLILLACVPGVLRAAETDQKGPATETGGAERSHVGAGYDLVQSGRYGEAAKEFRAALELNPGLLRARYQLAVCLLALGRLSESRLEFERLKTETSDDAGVLYYLGRLDLLEGKLDSAVARLLPVVAKPPYPDTAFYLGSAYLKQGNLVAAEKWLKVASEADPHDFRVPDHLARAYQKGGRREDAEKSYTLAGELRQRFSEASRHALACSHALETETFEAALEPCQNLLDRSDPALLTTLGMIYGQHGHYAAAIEPLERAGQLDPDSFEIQHNLGLTFFRLGRYAEARRPLERAVELRPDFFGSNALLGATLYVLKDDAPAYKMLDHAFQLNPRDQDTRKLLFNLSMMLAQKNSAAKEYGRALPYLEKAAVLSPQDSETHRQLAQVYARLGQSRKAAQEKRIADGLASNHQETTSRD